MTDALVIVRRELGALFRSLLAYVFLVVFLVLSQVFFVLPVFQMGTADLRSFHDMLPWWIAVFASFVTMRSWAEERQENTFEMLLTFPLRDRDLVLGKFLSAYLFLAIGIAGTFTLPLLLVALGSPDLGAIATGYLGALLFAAKVTAMGLFFSGFTRSQLLAAIATAAVSLACLLAGTETIAVLVDGAIPGFGSALRSLVGDWGRLSSFTRGVVELADVAWFAGWAAAFLYMNALHVGLRRHPARVGVLSAGIPLTLGCAVLLGQLGVDASWARADATEDRVNTLSPGTLGILSRARVPVRVTYYVSPKDDMPTQYKELERAVVDRLDEIRAAAGGRLTVRVQHMDAAAAVVSPEDEFGSDEDEEEKDDGKVLDPEKKKEKSLERRASEKGVQPFAVQSVEAASASTRLIFSTLAIAYREKDEEYLQPITPERVAEIEYLLANTVSRLVRPRAPKIALVLGAEPMDPQLRQMYQQMGRQIPDPYSGVERLLRAEKYDVQRVGLTGYEPLPEDYDTLVVVGPEEMDERQQWEVDRALASGKPTLLALQRYTWKYGQRDRRITAGFTENDPKLDEVLSAHGIGVSRDILMDSNHVTIQFPMGGIQDILGGVPVALPTHVEVTAETMNKDSVLVQRLSSILYLWGTALEIDRGRMAARGLEPTVLFESGEKSWTVEPDIKKLTFAPRPERFGKLPLAVQVRGQFQDALAGKPRPKWPFKLEMMPDRRPRPMPPDTPETPLVAAPGHLIVIGCARQWQNGFLEAIGNAPFLLNCIDALALDENLLQVRSRKPRDRRFDRKPSDAEAFFWRALPLAIVPLGLVGVGLGIGVVRLRRREAWAAEHGR